ncbi:hypothetical protein SAMN04487948_103498 [Halogranum amylolyticum]|uniref:DUF8052 domain-containing protein n=1 Tax=Halogranum amylolyticum TaxID=660520 RepID=A0A1H8R4R8_9EURY|nr:hypothetical protein [Halogranum amylolyticum]SEO61336.1 hypothetical protein SAMN04487948_103498 [Halogranum amylolyticum]
MSVDERREELASDPDVELPDDVPEWDDEYLDRVGANLMFSFDLERDRTVRSRTFDLFGTMRVESEKHFFHPALNYANHASEEYLFAQRRDTVRVADLEALASLAHDLADDPQWIVADEEHYGTDFTFVLVAPEITDDVREFVAGYDDRTLIKYGYYGHYEVNLAVVAPDEETVVASENTDVVRAFTLWSDADPTEGGGLLSRLFSRFR